VKRESLPDRMSGKVRQTLVISDISANVEMHEDASDLYRGYNCDLFIELFTCRCEG
jgi:hypothetical protein